MRVAASVLAIIMLLARVGAANDVTPEIRAGELGVRAIADPWQLIFEDESGSAILTEFPGTAVSAAGTLGFRTPAGWFHATRLASSRGAQRRWMGVLDTNDPLARQLQVVIAPDADGVIAVRMEVLGGPHADIEAIGVGFEAEAGERFFGLGERASALDHGGKVVENYVADGPYQEEERPVIALFVPPPGFRERDDATYYPVPWLLSSRGVGVLLDNPETSYFRLGTDTASAWSLEVTGAPEGEPPLPPPQTLSFRVFAGPTPADVLRRFTDRTGRQPPPAAPWMFGPWIQLGGSTDDRLAQMAKLRAADAPVSAIQTYTHYLPCGDHVNNRDGERANVETWHASGAAVTTYFNPMICESYEPRFSEAVAAGALTRRADGSPYVYNYTGSTVFRVGQFDMTKRAGRRAYGRLLGEAVADGHDGWMEDFGEYTPLDAVDARGRTGSAHHNHYVVDYHCGAWKFVRSAKRPVIRFQRSGWTGAAPCAQVVWNGDPSTTWGFDGLTSALWGGLGMGFSGIAFWGSDIGGFFALGERALTSEMLIRWVQFGAVSGVMRTQHNGFAVPAKVRPQIYDDDQIGNWKRYAKLRTQLYPYIAAAADEYRDSGLPIMRHLALAYPDDAEAVARDDEFLFGPDLLTAPVLAPGVTTRDVYLPSGSWIDLWRSGTWDSAAGAFLPEEASVLDGARFVTVPAPLDELPLFVRAGAVLPLLPPDVDTLADYGDSTSGLVRLADRSRDVVLLAFPRGESEARLFSSKERVRSRETSGAWELLIEARAKRTWSVQAALSTLEQPFTPCAVEWNGKPLAATDWSYDDAARLLRTSVTGRRGRLVVRACT